MRRTMKHIVTPLALLFFLQIPTACADDSVELATPVLSTTQISSASAAIQAEQISTDQMQTYGPTAENETLWSIAKHYQLSEKVSLYQSLLAIYHLNPKAFEDHNIHGLISGSTLLMPSLAQVQSESTQDARQIMAQDAKRPIPSQVDENIAPPPPFNAEDDLPKVHITSVGDSDNQQLTATKVQIEGANVGEESDNDVNLPSTSQVDLLAQRLNTELGNIQTQLDKLQTQLSDEERTREQVQPTPVSPQGLLPTLMSLLNQYPMLWLLVIVPLALILLLFRVITGNKANTEGTQTIEPQAQKAPIFDSESITADILPIESESEPQEPLTFVDSELPVYQEQQALEDAEREPQEFDAAAEVNPPTANKFDSSEDSETVAEEESFEQVTFEKDIAKNDEGKLETIPPNNDSLSSSNFAQYMPELGLETKPDFPLQQEQKKEAPNFVDDSDEEVDLDVGLGEFPDVLGDVKMCNVDDNYEINGKLDLAKAFIEIDDYPTAKKLLNAVMKSDELALKAEAEKLLARIKS